MDLDVLTHSSYRLTWERKQTYRKHICIDKLIKNKMTEKAY